MADRAHLTSVDALESFRASLVLYLSKARPTLEEITSELQRLRVWLEHDQRRLFERQRRQQSLKLEQARQALAQARLARPDAMAEDEQRAVRRTQQALEETELKLRRAQAWSRNFDSRVEPLSRQLDHLQNLMSTDLEKAVTHLQQTIRTLSDYAGTRPAASQAASSSQDSAEEESS